MPVIVCSYCGKNFANSKALQNHVSKKVPCRKALALAVAANLRRADSAEEGRVDDDDDDDDEAMLDVNQPEVTNEDDEMEWEAYMQDNSSDFVQERMAPKSNKSPFAATVEDYIEEDAEQGQETVFEPDVDPEFDFVEVETFNKAKEPGKTFGGRPTKFEEWRDELEKALTGEGKAPFSDTLNEKNWPKANWLMTSGLTNEARENYFNLPEVRQ